MVNGEGDCITDSTLNEVLCRKGPFVAQILLFASILCLLILPTTSHTAGSCLDSVEQGWDTPCCGPDPINGTAGTPLYMKGSDASEGGLSKDFPDDELSKVQRLRAPN